MTDGFCSRCIFPATPVCEVPQRDKRNDLQFAEKKKKKKETVVHKAVKLLIVRDFCVLFLNYSVYAPLRKASI